jgi:hypothetical protein
MMILFLDEEILNKQFHSTQMVASGKKTPVTIGMVFGKTEFRNYIWKILKKNGVNDTF